MKKLVGIPEKANEAGAGLVPYDKMSAAIEAASGEARALIEGAVSVDEVVGIRDRAIGWQASLRRYIKRAKNKHLEFKVSEIRILAERRAGQLLDELAETGQRAKRGDTTQTNRISSASDIPKKTLADYGITANQSWAWRKVAAIPQAEFEKAINRAKDKGLPPATTVRLATIRADRTFRAEKISLEKGAGRGPWKVIYADPPWPYSERPLRGGALPYKTLPLPKIESYLVNEEIKVADDAVLFLWGTIPLLPEALAVMTAWGFKYKNAIAWDKQAGVYGEYFHGRWEILLVGYRGKFPPPAITNLPNFLSIKRGGHSVKPDEFIALIERLYPSFGSLLGDHATPIGGWWDNRIELFARREAYGWVSVINQKFKYHSGDVMRILLENDAARQAAIAKHGKKKFYKMMETMAGAFGTYARDALAADDRLMSRMARK